MEKILLVVGDAAEVLDTMIPYSRLAEDYQVVVAGPKRRSYHMVLHEKPDDWDITQERPGYQITAELAFAEVDPNEYAGLVITGGRAPEYLRYDAQLIRITRHFFETQKPVACVCHGIEILAAAGVLPGCTATTVAKCQYDVEFSGGKYVDQPVVTCGNLVTARTWHDSAPWMKEYVRLLRESSGE